MIDLIFEYYNAFLKEDENFIWKMSYETLMEIINMKDGEGKYICNFGCNVKKILLGHNIIIDNELSYFEFNRLKKDKAVKGKSEDDWGGLLD